MELIHAHTRDGLHSFAFASSKKIECISNGGNKVSLLSTSHHQEIEYLVFCLLLGDIRLLQYSCLTGAVQF